MKRRQKIALVAVALLALYILLEAELTLPLVGNIKDKPVILYYNTFNLPINASSFKTVIDFARSNHFNALMLLVYAYGQALFNQSEISYFSSFAAKNNITFVPSYYIVSGDDRINTTGYSWVNLDMEKLSPKLQSSFYAGIASQVKLVSVTSPYGQRLPYHPEMNIVETYYATPVFWYYQLWFDHSAVVCSVSAHSAESQTAFNAEFNYCLERSRGVMVFDYWNMIEANLTAPNSSVF